MRMFLACVVLLTHSFYLYEGKGNYVDYLLRWTNYQVGSGTLAVYCFFIISGFMIIQSLERSPNIWNYIKKRLLRIIPAFAFALFFITFIIAPIVSDITLQDYWSFAPGSPLHFFFHSLSFHIIEYSWSIEGVFTHNPWPAGLNGSMWTLKHEIAAYIVLPILFIIFARRKREFFVLLSLLIVSFTLIEKYTALRILELSPDYWVMGGGEYIKFLIFSVFFCMGAIYWLYKEYIPVSKKLLCIAVILSVLASFIPYMIAVLFVTLPYITLVVGSMFSVQSFTTYGDFSYGMYILAFPIQQTLMHFITQDGMTVYTFFMISLLMTFILSMFSWFIIEKPALRFK